MFVTFCWKDAWRGVAGYSLDHWGGQLCALQSKTGIVSDSQRSNPVTDILLRFSGQLSWSNAEKSKRGSTDASSRFWKEEQSNKLALNCDRQSRNWKNKEHIHKDLRKECWNANTYGSLWTCGLLGLGRSGKNTSRQNNYFSPSVRTSVEWME